MRVISIVLLAACAAAEVTNAQQPDPHRIEERRATSHPMRYLVALPSGWSGDRTWPVVVVIPDAFREFQNTAQAFVDARGSRPFIIVVPLVLSGGAPAEKHQTDFDYAANDWKIIARVGACRFDEDGMTAVVSDVAKRYHGADRIYLTGWDAGGHVVWAQVFNHPDRIAGAVAVIPHFQGRCVDAKAASNPRATIPLRVFHGSDDTGWGSSDQPWWIAQWHAADSVARSRGMGAVADSTILGQGRGPMPAEVLDFFAPLVKP